MPTGFVRDVPDFPRLGIERALAWKVLAAERRAA